MSAVSCPGCDTEYASTALVCPNCHRLVHGDELKGLGAQAAAAELRGDKAAARTAFQRAVLLLPVESRQRLTIQTRLAELDGEPGPVRTTPEARPAWVTGGGAIGAITLIVWKLKGVLLLVFGKLKFLTLGFSKAGTLFSFLASFGVYWSLWGWRYALGFLVAMYIHEMGHVAALRRFGIPASAPMFIPGVGAFVRMNRHPATAGEDARIGLAGPEWGLGAALVAYLAYGTTGEPIWAAIGYSAAYLNLFNLLPIWQLDGGRGFAALTREQRIVVAVTLAVAWGVTGQGLLGLIGAAAAYRAFLSDAPPGGDTGVLGRFVGLILVFSSMLLLGVPRH
ncbi:MAG: site-2 protease family protein [Vicinamibacteria bacterium]|nr:site-2 protease family protein [Vicinamibacteria bacterium]